MLSKLKFFSLFLIVVMLAGYGAASSVAAQSETDAADSQETHPYYVFMQADAADPQRTNLIFIDALSGEQNSVGVSGSRFTVLGRSILYFDASQRRVNVVTSEGDITPHPFLQLPSDALRIDWVISSDGKQIAWTVTSRTDPASLNTQTYVAQTDGSSQQLVREESRKDGLRVLPVAFDSTQTKLYFDYQPDGYDQLGTYPQYAGLASLALDTASPEALFLPGEPGNFTGAGFGGEYFLRLALADGQQGFDLHVNNLVAGTSGVVPALQLSDTFTQAGDILISPDGRQAVYIVSQIETFGAGTQPLTRTALVLVDLRAMTQTILADVNSLAHPLEWTEDNSAIIFTSLQQPGTWKITVSTSGGQPEKIAEQTYLGMLHVET
jgi:hypothetical protein